jgi:hypothetical protein
MTFDNPDLRRIQFHFIEEGLIQAVGRARMLRTGATVEVFSGFPLVGFEQRNLRELHTPESGDDEQDDQWHRTSNGGVSDQ